MGSISQELRQAVLQSAIQGKLTQQLLSDGNARDLFVQIRVERERLIKEKKIKKEKLLAPIMESEVPFDIPDNWEWAYVGDIFEHNAGKALNSKNTKGRKFKYITTSNVYWDHFELDNLREMYYTDDEIEKYSVRKGDLLVLEGGDVGRTAIWDRDETYCVQNHVHRLRPYIPVAIKYFYYCMMYFKSAGMINGKGIAIQGLSANALHSIVVPVPPLAEQYRIVIRVEELIAKVDELEKIENELNALREAFPNDMKASLLQSAMQGKLIGQSWNEEDNSDLYKPLWKVTAWDKRFKGVPSYKQRVVKNYNNILARNFTDYEVVNGNVKILSTGKYEGFTTEEKLGYVVQEAEVVTLPGGGSPDGMKYYKGKFVSSDNRIGCSIDDEVLNNKFLYYFLCSRYDALCSIYRGISIKHPNMPAVLEFLIPVSSIIEQERIVEKLDKLLPLCESLKM